jgi:Zn-dependent protease with chaperone function
MPTAAPSSTTESVALPFSIVDRIPRRPVPFGYRASLAAVALTMVLLPIVYGALIVLVGYGVYFYAIHATGLFETDAPGWIKLFVYIAPIFVGVVLIAFMVKPLFTWKTAESEAAEVDLDAHPVLRQLIEQVCAAVGAPKPVSIEIDCQVNAGARLRRGLLSLGRRDLVLCIGLPLVKGFSTRQLAGVLAHEFGHFAQGAGMALTYVIRSINLWFARVVFERDQWDVMLEQGSEKGDYRIMVLFGCARAGLWVSRQVLRGLMNIGHAVSCLQLRQMEYDADYYEVALVGAETFVATARDRNRLNAASQMAFEHLQELWRTRQTVDDVAELIVSGRTQLGADVLTKIDAHLAGSRTRWFDTHPSDAQRIAHAERLALAGIFSGDGTAAELFCDVDDLCRNATQHFYERRGLEVDPSAVVSAGRLRESSALAQAADEAWSKLNASVVNLSRPLRWTADDFAPLDISALMLTAKLAECRAELGLGREQAIKDEQTFGSTLEHLALLEHACTLLSLGVTINPRKFHLAQPEIAEAEAEAQQTRVRLQVRVDALKPFDAAVHRWIVLVGAAVRTPAVAQSLSPDMCTNVIRFTDALVQYDPWIREFPNWLRLLSALRHYSASDAAGKFEYRFNEAVRNEREHARKIVENALPALHAVPNPFAKNEQSATAGSTLSVMLEGVHGEGRLVVLMRHVAESYFRSLAYIALYGAQLERQLGG